MISYLELRNAGGIQGRCSSAACRFQRLQDVDVSRRAEGGKTKRCFFHFPGETHASRGARHPGSNAHGRAGGCRQKGPVGGEKAAADHATTVSTLRLRAANGLVQVEPTLLFPAKRCCLPQKLPARGRTGSPSHCTPRECAAGARCCILALHHPPRIPHPYRGTMQLKLNSSRRSPVSTRASWLQYRYLFPGSDAAVSGFKEGSGVSLRRSRGNATKRPDASAPSQHGSPDHSACRIKKA